MSRTIKAGLVLVLALASTVIGATLTRAAQSEPGTSPRPQGPCDIYAAAGAPCAAAHSTTRALYAAYDGPLYQVMRQSDGKKLNIGVVKAAAADPGGYADAAAQDRFCAGTICWIATIYDQSGHHNELTQAPRGGFSGPAMGGFNNLPIADSAPVTVMGHKVYGVFIAPGMGLRQNDAKGTAVDDQAEGQYWVINGHHYNSGCCFDYGNAEIDSKDDGNGTMETTYYGDATPWYHGTPPGPWVMTDQENNLVGCVNADGADKLCKGLPNITWRFVTAMAKGEPHHWSSMGGDAQKGPLQVMFDGRRVDNTYDPMRKQGAILLGNGGDNSVGSQGTFYEGAMTKGGTFPSHATDQLVQANIVAARYDVAPVGIVPAAGKPTGVQTFAPGASQDVIVSFTNIDRTAASGVRLSLALPASWRAAASGATSFASVAPGASVSVAFKVTPASAAFNGDLTGKASWRANGRTRSETAVEKVRNASPIRINEFRIGDAADPTNAFIELYNAGSAAVDVSGWALTQHQAQQPVFSDIKIPAGTLLQPQGFYVLGLSASGLVAPARAGDTVIHVRSVAGLKAGDTIRIGGESRKIASVGTAASPATTLWQPLPDGPVITAAAGATKVPVTSTEGFAVGQKIALGHGATYPTVARGREQMEVATVTAVGKPGTMAFLAADAMAGTANIKVSAVADITAGDRIRLDIASIGHGVETVTVKNVGTAALRDVLTADTRAGATSLTLRPGFGTFNLDGLPTTASPAVGDTLIVGMPGALETVTITATNGATVEVRPALARAHASGDPAVVPGTGLDLAAPLKFNHAANLPFSVRGTGITFAPAAKFAHSSNEPVQALGTGVTLDKPLAGAHPVDTAVEDSAVTSAGYQGGAPNQWFGGPALSTSAGSMVLRDAKGLVVDSLNYGLLVDPWASKGDQTVSGSGASGCRVAAPGAIRGFGRAAPVLETNRSAGRFPDGADSDSNCTDFMLQPATVLSRDVSAGAANIKVASVAGFAAGQTVMIDGDANRETVTIAAVGTAGATSTSAAAEKGATVLSVASLAGFTEGQTVTIGNGADRETAVIVAVRGGRAGARITIAAPLSFAHPADAEVSGSGITLATGLAKAHAAGAQVATDLPTPGAPNKYAGSR